MRMRQGAPRVSCSPTMIPAVSQRCSVDGATPRTAAAFVIVNSSPLGRSAAGAAVVAIDGDHHILHERAQQFFLVAVRGGGGRPYASQIITERAEALGVSRADDLPPLVLADGKFTLRVLEIPQALLPLRFQAAGDEPILRLHGAIAALGAFGLIPRSLG